jgi:hypothetical protein
MEGYMRRKMRLIEGNAECRHLKIVTHKETLRQVFIYLRPRTPHSIQYTFPHREGGGGGGATVHKAGSKIRT